MSSASEFSKKIDNIINHGWITAGLSIGTRLGLFEGLAKMAVTEEDAVTSQQLADSLSMKERYVREWISGMVCGAIVDHKELEGVDKYWIASDKLPALLGKKDLSELSFTNRIACNAMRSELLVGGLAEYTELEKCFHIDGPRAMQPQQPNMEQTRLNSLRLIYHGHPERVGVLDVQAVIRTEINKYPILHEYLSKGDTPFKSLEDATAFLGGDEITKLLDRGIRVLEMGCGGAVPTRLLANNFPNSMFTASDISADQLTRAKKGFNGLTNVSTLLLDACAVPDTFNKKFDLILCCDMFHDSAYPSKLIEGVRRLLSPEGIFFMLEVDMLGSLKENMDKDAQMASFFYMCSLLYCMPTSLYHPGGCGMGACAGAPLMEQMLRDGGFRKVERVVNSYGVCFLCSN